MCNSIIGTMYCRITNYCEVIAMKKYIVLLLLLVVGCEEPQQPIKIKDENRTADIKPPVVPKYYIGQDVFVWKKKCDCDNYQQLYGVIEDYTITYKGYSQIVNDYEHPYDTLQYKLQHDIKYQINCVAFIIIVNEEFINKPLLEY